VNKSVIRKKILKLREKYYFESSSININPILRLLKKKGLINKIIGGYHPFNYEIDVFEILEKLQMLGYLISLPKIKKNSQMDFFEWSLNDPFQINKLGIPEPISNKIVYPDILLVPLVAFDESFHRIGYGGGFYDRYIKKIKKQKKIITIGLAHSFQKVKKIPTNKYDMKLDFIVTDKDR
tara:strand:- start:2331 stop:2870 length:540 start_codon:yes stop_codon:yes gene_type:complete